jgi:prephenate dehydratase
MTKIAYQGEPGAFSHQACKRWYPELEPEAFSTFEAAFAAVREGECCLGMIPVENSLAGRVSDVHHLLPHSGLRIIAERFLAIEMVLMAVPETSLDQIKIAMSHPMALMQCRQSMQDLGLKPEVFHDTSGAARSLSETRELNRAAIAADIAAELYGLKILKRNFEDARHNTTRFLALGLSEQAALTAEAPDTRMITSFVFGVRNMPAALYKAMGGFATNGVNMIRLESYIRDGVFSSSFFYAEVEGRPSDPELRRAFDELKFFAAEVAVLGVYAMDGFRDLPLKT